MSYTPRILIADDDVLVCETLEELLFDQNYEIRSVHSGEEAIDSLDKDPYDFVLLDIVMPDTGDLEVLNHITGQSLDAMVIVMTGYASTESAIDALNNGAYYYIKKPL
jgi:DNA-binding NtrC family response regulator